MISHPLSIEIEMTMQSTVDDLCWVTVILKHCVFIYLKKHIILAIKPCFPGTAFIAAPAEYFQIESVLICKAGRSKLNLVLVLPTG